MPYNDKSRKNLKPFTGANDPRRQNGRKKGQINRATVIRNFLAQEPDPRLLISYQAKERAGKLKNKTCLEAVLYTLADQALSENTRASDILLRELRYADKDSPAESPFYEARRLQIEVVQTADEYEKLKEIEQRLEEKYGEDYLDLLDG